jgi:Tfp pilus assembly protein PilO
MSGALLLAVNLAVFAAFSWPRLTRVRRAEGRAQEVVGQRAALERVWSQVVSRREVLAQNQKDIEILNRDHLKPRTDDLFAAQREIEELAKDAGLRPKRSTYLIESIKGTGLVRCKVTLPLDGTYVNLTGFLSRIGSTRRFIVVDQMALAQDEQGARMNLTLSAIFKDGDSRASQ